eukprot:gene13298-9136_t
MYASPPNYSFGSPYIKKSHSPRSSATHLVLQTQSEIGRLLLLERGHDDILQYRTSGDRLRRFSQYFFSDISLEEFNLLTFGYLRSNHFDPSKAAKVMLHAGIHRQKQNLNKVCYSPCLLPVSGYDLNEVHRLLGMHGPAPDVSVGPEEQPSAEADQGISTSNSTSDHSEASFPSSTQERPSKRLSQFRSYDIAASAIRAVMSAMPSRVRQERERRSEEEGTGPAAPNSGSFERAEEGKNGASTPDPRSPSVDPSLECSPSRSFSPPQEKDYRDLIYLNAVLRPITTAVRRHVTVMFHYWDKSGRPVMYITMNRLVCEKLVADLSQLCSTGTDTNELLVLFYTYVLEVTQLLIRFNQRRFEGESESVFTECKSKSRWIVSGAVTSCIVVINCEGSSFGRSSKKALRRMVKILLHVSSVYYPTVVHHIYVTGSSAATTCGYRALHNVLDSSMKDKVSFCSDDCVSTLSREIDVKNIPVIVGGACNCSLCLSQHSERGSTPTYTQTEHTEQEDSGSDNVKPHHPIQKIIVPARKSRKFFFGLQAGEEVGWDFRVGEQKEIFFSVLFVHASQGDRTTVVEVKQLKDGSGHYVAANPGTLILDPSDRVNPTTYRFTSQPFSWPTQTSEKRWASSGKYGLLVWLFSIKIGIFFSFYLLSQHFSVLSCIPFMFSFWIFCFPFIIMSLWALPIDFSSVVSFTEDKRNNIKDSKPHAGTHAFGLCAFLDLILSLLVIVVARATLWYFFMFFSTLFSYFFIEKNIPFLINI